MMRANKKADLKSVRNPRSQRHELPLFRGPLTDDELAEPEERARRFALRVMLGERLTIPKELNSAMEDAVEAIEAVAAEYFSHAWQELTERVRQRIVRDEAMQ